MIRGIGSYSMMNTKYTAYSPTEVAALLKKQKKLFASHNSYLLKCDEHS